MDPLKRRLLGLSQSLWRKHNISLAETTALESNDEFSALRRNFLFAHGTGICRDLQSVYRQHLRLVPASLGDKVQQRFLESCMGEGKVSGHLRPAFHGTARENISPILQQGLLIPGDGNSLPVVNGSAHGLGIYTGTVGTGGVGLSHNYCRGGPMLICGVMDDAQPVQQYTLGIRSVSAESGHVRHVGNAMVIFESRRVAPLFAAIPRFGRSCAQSFAVLRKPMISVGVNSGRHQTILQRIKDQYPEQRSSHRYRHGPCSHAFHPRQPWKRWCSHSGKEFKDPCKYLSRRAARKRRSKLS